MTWRRPVLAVVSLLIALSALSATAMSFRQRFSISQQALSSALIEFARQGRLQLVTPLRPLESLRSNEVRGVHGASDALDRLLVCTGLEGRIDGNVIRLRELPHGPELSCVITADAPIALSRAEAADRLPWLDHAREGCNASFLAPCAIGDVGDTDASPLAITSDAAFAEAGVGQAAAGSG